MMIFSLWGLIIGAILCLSSLITFVSIYLRKRFRRDSVWQASTDVHTVISSEPVSRRSSTSNLVNSEKPSSTSSSSSRSRSASFSEDLSARLQILPSNTCYRSFTPPNSSSMTRSKRSSLGANIRLPMMSNPSSTMPSMKFQLKYDHMMEKLSITIFQTYNYIPMKHTQTMFVIVYLLPNEDEPRQTQSSSNGIFNECFQFPLQKSELCKRTLRLTVYTVDSNTRIRNSLGHVFLKLDQFINDKTFSTDILSEYLTPDLQIRTDYLGELILTSTYLKNQNLIQIRIQQMKHLHIDQTKARIPLKAYFSGQIVTSCKQCYWTNTASFLISSLSSIHLEQELNLSIHSQNEQNINCHLRLHFHGLNQIHSHARWQQPLRSNIPTSLTVPLVAV
ncbi:unnamed protein product [Adineta ricciae]|uniref:C2 domain-containing protein n=1 Tax=Adineta ricciae TaxID=249248 RepID=A0A813MZW3_ADIRI|nr:unnamed protein product [Adineta ricciae]CAF0982771.1 unnamed protein product [Adineta ricciae]